MFERVELLIKRYPHKFENFQVTEIWLRMAQNYSNWAILAICKVKILYMDLKLCGNVWQSRVIYYDSVLTQIKNCENLETSVKWSISETQNRNHVYRYKAV